MNVWYVFKIIINYIWEIITIPIKMGPYTITIFSMMCYILIMVTILSFLGITLTRHISIWDKSEQYAHKRKEDTKN